MKEIFEKFENFIYVFFFLIVYFCYDRFSTFKANISNTVNMIIFADFVK